MAFSRGDVVRCVDAAAYNRVQSTLICCDGSAFSKKADGTGPDKHKRPFIVVDVLPKSDKPRRPKLVLLISVSTGLPKAGGQTSFPMGINYLSCSPDAIPYKTGSYIVYGLGAVAREEDLEQVWSRQTPQGAIQKVSLNNLSERDKKIHEAAMTKAWKGNEHVAAAQWKAPARPAASKAKEAGDKSPSQPELEPVK